MDLVITPLLDLIRG